MDEMDLAAFTSSFEAPTPSPKLEELAARYAAAFRRTRDVHSAMAAVNELSPEPYTYENFMHQLDHAA